MLSLKTSKSIMAGSALVFIAACTISYRHCSNSTTYSQENTVQDSTASSTQEVQLNKHAVKFVYSYIQSNTESLSKIKEKSSASFRVMDRVFKKYKLPVELKYLAVIESELNPNAVSKAGAVGPWQLMPETAKVLGLTVTDSYDERTQYAKSTKAAALYLRDLYSEFDDWLLVLAAYNCGPGPVYKAIRKSGSRNFWTLQNYLPAESRDHVKKFIATEYFFEGKGSETTLTKAENLQHAQTMMMLASLTIKNVPADGFGKPAVFADAGKKDRAYSF